METAKMADELANNLRSQDWGYAMDVARVLDYDGNQSLLEKLCKYWFTSRQDDVLRILYKAGERLELERCLNA